MEAEAIARMVSRATNLSEELAARLLDDAVCEGRIETKTPPPLDYRDAMAQQYPSGFTAIDREYGPLRELFTTKFNAADVDALAANLCRPAQAPEAEAEKPGPKLVPPGQLVKFLHGFADGTRSKAECKAAAEAHFGHPIPWTNQWEPVWRAFPEEKKLKRGQRRPLKPHKE